MGNSAETDVKCSLNVPRLQAAMLQRRRPLTVAMNCMILTKMERGMFFGNTPLCRGNRVSTTILRSLRHNERSFDTDVYTADVAHYYTVCIAEANTVYTLSCG